MIEYFDSETQTWVTSRFEWLPEDIEFLNSAVGYQLYRPIGTAA